MRVVFHVRCHGEPDETLEEVIIQLFSHVVEYPRLGWGILTVGRTYYHDDPLCEGHPDAHDECERKG